MKESTMQVPAPDSEPLLEDLLQDLPPETAQMARECQAFTPTRTITTPHQLLRVIFLLCGLDRALCDGAATVTRRRDPLTDTAIAQCLAAWGPLGNALLPRLPNHADLSILPDSRRFQIIEGSTIPGPI
jgi:hypothetical protein